VGLSATASSTNQRDAEVRYRPRGVTRKNCPLPMAALATTFSAVA
jgi:hypothetical protein